jgi:hypothetical protein
VHMRSAALICSPQRPQNRMFFRGGSFDLIEILRPLLPKRAKKRVAARSAATSACLAGRICYSGV